MKAASKHYEPESLIGIVADPKTGKILAMSSKPSYDPNSRQIKYFSMTQLQMHLNLDQQ